MMTEKERLVNIKDSIAEALNESDVGKFNIYLFGSRARSVERADSDYDIMVVTQRNFNGREKFNLLRKIRKRIKYLGLAIDVILKSAGEYNSARENFGTFVYSIRDELVAI